MRGLYVHIPFCVKKCAYCDFYSLPSRQDAIDEYIKAVLQEADAFVNPSQSTHSARSGQAFVKGRYYSFETLYIGGGTPSLLGAEALKTLVNGLNRVVPPLSGSLPRGGERTERYIEATIEANPESATREFLEAAKECGINRVSFGVQSLSDEELKAVGRIHTAYQAIQAIKLAQNTGFKSISADLIIGLAGQTWPSLRNSLEKLVDLGVPHLSVYCLSLEEGTPLASNPPQNLPSDDTQAELFYKVRELLMQSGFVHYEISNFAFEGHQCMHNLNYWRGGEYLGLGPAAASHIDGKRFKNKADLDGYLKNPAGQIEYIEELKPVEKAAEEAMLRLRLPEEGLDTQVLVDRFGSKEVEGLRQRLDEMVAEGMLIRTGTRYRLEPSRIMTSNPIFARVISG